jgi:hypothetical protein
MSSDPDLKAALAALNRESRRARLLDSARGRWTLRWEDLPYLVPIAICSYLLFRGPADLSAAALVLILMNSMAGGWQNKRLGSRLDAVVQLLDSQPESRVN